MHQAAVNAIENPARPPSFRKGKIIHCHVISDDPTRLRVSAA